VPLCLRSEKLRPTPYMPLSSQQRGLIFAAIFVIIFLLHARLLQLPYFWDEAGYYVPAARDFLLTGSLIPHTTVSNAHPPLVMAWVALWWKLVGYAPLVTRSAMLVVAAFSLFGLFRLAERAANTEVAIAATLCTAVYPVFFAQSSLAQVDLAAAGLTFWGLCAYLEDRPIAVGAWFTLAVLAKETAIIAPMALAAWELVTLALRRFGATPTLYGAGFTPSGRGKTTAKDGRAATEDGTAATEDARLGPEGGRAALQGRGKAFQMEGALAPAKKFHAAQIISLLFPLLPLTLWYAYHYSHTGYVFGNPEFFRYNVASTLNPLRFLLALALRLWQTFGYLHLWLPTVFMLLAMLLAPVTDKNVGTPDLDCPGDRSTRAIERQRIPTRIQAVFFMVIAAYVVSMALIGGAVLARYMLPAVPLVIILAVSTLWRRLRCWPVAIGLIVLAFVAAWYWNPPYGFSPEDNLAYRDYVVLHQNAERFLEARYPMAHVLTAWPASDELARPWLGYVTRPVQVVRIEDFSLEQMISAADFRDHYEVALVFSTKYEPEHPLLERWMLSSPNPNGWRRRAFAKWQFLKARFFGYHIDLPPEVAARILGGHIVFSETRKGQWVAVIELQREEILNAENARIDLHGR
jgi:Dolichyl-phosphate-mannose-protein mannosyltransferase